MLYPSGFRETSTYERSVDVRKSIGHYRMNFYFSVVLLDSVITLEIFYFMVSFVSRKIFLGKRNEAISLLEIASFKYPRKLSLRRNFALLPTYYGNFQ